MLSCNFAFCYLLALLLFRCVISAQIRTPEHINRIYQLVNEYADCVGDLRNNLSFRVDPYGDLIVLPKNQSMDFNFDFNQDRRYIDCLPCSEISLESSWFHSQYLEYVPTDSDKLGNVLDHITNEELNISDTVDDLHLDRCTRIRTPEHINHINQLANEYADCVGDLKNNLLFRVDPGGDLAALPKNKSRDLFEKDRRYSDCLDWIPGILLEWGLYDSAFLGYVPINSDKLCGE